MRNLSKILVRKSEEKEPFGTSRRRCKVNIKMDIKMWGVSCRLD